MSISAVEFDIQTPCDDETIRQHIDHAVSLGLPEADRATLPTLVIVANGPSAVDAPLISYEALTLAVNGSLKLFLDRGALPTFWAACDPQESVADFLPDEPPTGITYLVASKCHPKVFEKLKDRTVFLWHIDDYPIPGDRRAVKCASTVTLCVQSLMRRLGYRRFEVYGWDACYAVTGSGEIQHHASDKPLPEYPEDTVDLCIGAEVNADGQMTGGRWFKTTRTWAAEAQDAVIQLHHADYTTKVHGDGMIKALLATRSWRAASSPEDVAECEAYPQSSARP